MKRFSIILIISISASLNLVAQDASYNDLTVNSLTRLNGASGLFGWGLSTDNSLDPRPNYSQAFQLI